ncbi:hypothetical protein LCL87_16290 [Rhodococcus hoagii]|nr:hypothetical protein [Prescottella equi]
MWNDLFLTATEHGQNFVQNFAPSGGWQHAFEPIQQIFQGHHQDVLPALPEPVTPSTGSLGFGS